MIDYSEIVVHAIVYFSATLFSHTVTLSHDNSRPFGGFQTYTEKFYYHSRPGNGVQRYYHSVQVNGVYFLNIPRFVACCLPEKTANGAVGQSAAFLARSAAFKSML